MKQQILNISNFRCATICDIQNKRIFLDIRNNNFGYQKKVFWISKIPLNGYFIPDIQNSFFLKSEIIF